MCNRILRRTETVNIGKIKEAHFTQDNSTWNLDLIGEFPGIAILANEVAKFYESQGGPNFVEFVMFDRVTKKEYSITIRPSSRPTPQEIASGLRAALEEIVNNTYAHADNPHYAREVALTTLARFGYLNTGAKE